MMFRAVEEELALQRGLLGLIVPETLVDTFILKQEGMKEQGAAEKPALYGLKDHLTALGDVAVGAIRVDRFASHLRSVANEPMLMLQEMEALYASIERQIRRQGVVVDKVQTMGDVITVAGPLFEDHKLQELAASRAVRAAGKQRKVYEAEEKDSCVAAGLALLDIVGGIAQDANSSYSMSASAEDTSSKIGSVSCVLHVSDAFACIIGKTRPTFSLIGPAPRTTEELIRASPSGSVVATESFLRLLRDDHVTLPRGPDDFSVGNPMQWRLRGAGSKTVFPLRLPSRGIPAP